jgi:hypothetical protein
MFRKHYCAKGMMSSADEINDIRRKFYSAYGVSDSDDEIGNLLRDFYSAYGIQMKVRRRALTSGSSSDRFRSLSWISSVMH